MTSTSSILSSENSFAANSGGAKLSCRFCAAPIKHSMCDLGMSPVSNAFVKPENSHEIEPFYPLHALVCSQCFLVQLGEFQSREEIFDGEYAYFSSMSSSWLEHSERYVNSMIERFEFDGQSQVVEIASNDGYLLQFFKKKGVPVLGIEPTANTAEVAVEKGVPTRVQFFGCATANELVAAGQQADLLLGNNVLAHVPDINDFVGGMKIALKATGVITMEFPHLQELIEKNQFDTVYHEHFSYLSLNTVERIFAHHGLTLFDVEQLSTHGGSLRIFARHQEDEAKAVTDRLVALRESERSAGLTQIETYEAFQEQVQSTKRKLLRFLIDAKDAGKTVVGYGAPAKGNTLLNYCGIREDLIDYTVDTSPHKQGMLLPGVRIPVYPPAHIFETRPDYILILPWNLRDEVMEQMAGVAEWGGRFVVPIPEVTVLD